ncbi:EAL domain-containing protein [Oculatella sp. LEGE 06141]|nr:EAL domain-containing protein [Oculatella sp. LEGE 06141]
MGFDIIIARSQSDEPPPEEPITKIDLGEVVLSTSKSLDDNESVRPSFSPLHNLLEPYELLIQNLINHLSSKTFTKSLAVDANVTFNPNVATDSLNAIRRASNAEFVFVLREQRQNSWIVSAQSELDEAINHSDYLDTLKSTILSTISVEEIFNPIHHGIYKIYSEETEEGVKASVVIPLPATSRQAEFMVVCGILQDSHFLKEPYGKILAAFYHASQQAIAQPSLVEAALLDDLKRTYGFVPLSFYNRRFELFDERLKTMIVHFEPIFCFSNLSISSWEALARDPDKLHAPSDLFQTVELWGDHFTIELDIHFLETAIETYIEARKQAKMNRGYEIVPLSVNVYPASLMRRAYREKAFSMMEKYDFLRKNLILEISEKTKLLAEGNDPESLLKARKELQKYVNKGIRFAIDDFGVGYGSISRLTKLELPYIKIDREILHHKHSEVIIKFVHELVHTDNQSPPQIILEGFDESVRISLAYVKAIGIDYIQGHLVGMAGAEIYRLNKEKVAALKERLTMDLGED